MDNKAKEARNEYFREYRKKNKEKIQQINSRYWTKKAQSAEDKTKSSNS